MCGKGPRCKTVILIWLPFKNIFEIKKQINKNINPFPPPKKKIIVYVK